MAKNKNFKKPQPKFDRPEENEPKEPKLHPEAKKTVWAISILGISLILVLAAFGKAGPLGEFIYQILETLLGSGYFILPTALGAAAIILFISEKQKAADIAILGVSVLALAVLGIMHLVSYASGGWLGFVFGSLEVPFGKTAALIISILAFVASFVVASNTPIKIKLPQRKSKEEKSPTITGTEGNKEIFVGSGAPTSAESEGGAGVPTASRVGKTHEEAKEKNDPDFKPKKIKPQSLGNYVLPPLSLLKSANDKPTTGDLLANANIIKRTLDSFGIPVEMGEINVGPSVTRYTLKPAEGVKLSRIEALHKDLALALAAHPIRIEAPIPGKSLVGIEVPNKAAALVRLGSLMNYPEFQKSGSLGFALGRDVSGEPIFSNIDKMPHLLVAGATGSGKSILIHSLLLSLLYKNSPATLRLILIDPKRVELSIYEGLPHLIGPVVVDNKKAVGVFRWAISEMDRRYDLLLAAGSRDIKGYNSGNPEEQLPYLLIVIDELADLMTSYGREVEGFIVRLAQMARATGIHLILSTQRPSVEVITGLIKANITSRVALQVASQIDSRTILDTSGAEKLLGHGDLLYISSELSKPKRIQGTYVTEEETDKVAKFIKEHNKSEETEAPFSTEKGQATNGENPLFDGYLEEDGDELYDEAVRVVSEAKKASASLLQRRLKVGYARAARLLDLMEAKGVIGPGDGAKPRDVYLDTTTDNQQ